LAVLIKYEIPFSSKKSGNGAGACSKDHATIGVLGMVWRHDKFLCLYDGIRARNTVPFHLPISSSHYKFDYNDDCKSISIFPKLRCFYDLLSAECSHSSGFLNTNTTLKGTSSTESMREGFQESRSSALQYYVD